MALEPDDRAAIAAARAGDREAFGALVPRYQEAAFRAAWLIVRDAAAAEDVAQEAFVRAHASLARFDDAQPFRPWLLRIVTNLALNEARARTRRTGFLGRLAGLRGRDTPDPAELVAEADEQARLHSAINELPEDDRVILYLRYFVDLPEREIALAIGRPPGTVKSRLHRASARLREVIERRYPGLQPGWRETVGGHD